MYHAVIASFPTQSLADEFLSKVDRNLYQQAGSVARDGKVRVYAGKFDNREQAESYILSLRTHAQYKDAWLFISR